MARTGRPPKTAAQRAQEGGTDRTGSISHRPQPEPVVVGGRLFAVEPPADLPESAREVWEFIVAELADAGIIDKVDLPQLRAFCIQVGHERDASDYVGEPATAEELDDLEARIRRMRTVSEAITGRIATQLRAGLAPDVKDVNASARYEMALTNLETYLHARRRLGNMVALGSTGQLVEHPLVGTSRAAASLLLRFATEFALTPTARARLGIAILEGKSLAAELDGALGPNPRRDQPAIDPPATPKKKPRSKAKPKK